MMLAGIMRRSGPSSEASLESPAVLRKCKYAFLTLPNYSLIAVANALEPLRMANRLVGKDVYEWSVISLDGRAVDASSGLALSPDRRSRQTGSRRHSVRVRRRQRSRGGLAGAADRAAAPGRPAGAAGRPVHRRLRAGARRPAGQFSRDHPLGKSVGPARGVSPGAASAISCSPSTAIASPVRAGRRRST